MEEGHIYAFCPFGIATHAVGFQCALLMNESSCAYEIIQETLQATGNSLSVSSVCSMVAVTL